MRIKNENIMNKMVKIKFDEYEMNKKKINLVRKCLLLSVDQEIKKRDISLINTFIMKDKIKEEYIVVLEDTIYDSSSNKSELFNYNSNKSNSFSKKSNISPVSPVKSSSSFFGNSKLMKNEVKTCNLSLKIKKNDSVIEKPGIMEAPHLKKKDLFIYENKSEKSDIYLSYLKLRRLSNKLKLKNNPMKSLQLCSKDYFTNKHDDILNIPSPLILSSKNTSVVNDSSLFSLKNEIKTREEIMKKLKNTSIKILKEKVIGKKFYNFQDIINQIENNHENSIFSCNHSSNSTSFYDEKPFLSENNKIINYYQSPLKINTFDNYKKNVNNSASKLELNYNYINLSPIEQNCIIKLKKCDFETTDPINEIKKIGKKDSFSIKLKKC